MDRHSFDVLELKKIIEDVAECAATSLGMEIINRLTPVSNTEYIEERLLEVSVAKELLNNYSRVPFGGIKDLREIITKASKGIVLSTEEMVDVHSTARGLRNLKNYFQEIVEKTDPNIIEKRYAPVINQGLQIEVLYQLEKEIDKCINEYGEIRDNASSKLSSLRSQMDTIENRIRDRLDSIIRGTKYQSMLQDSLVTKRENRYVVPVKQEYRNTFSGIVHDHSASGMTIFMEPMAIVQLNNKLRETKNEEEAEIYRILQQLTEKVGEKSEILKSDLKIAAILDVIFARAAYSEKINGTAPDVNDQGYTKIIQGKHPLLQNEPVPIDIEVGKDFNTLVITGPNTGGKTVAIKTVGLFVLMTELGLHIPVDRGSVVSLYANVYADIGDEQSIEQNLSTFSSHMNNIKIYLEKTNSDSLVLLDELGAGTDPREGAALGISILERLRRNGATTIATTHYSQLKSYAYDNEGVENASVEFDLETLRPTYKLIMGIPGGSNAFEIALKLGLPSEIISEAKKLVDSKELEVEDIIKELNSERKKYHELRVDIQRNNEELESLKKNYQERIKKLEEREQRIITEAEEEARTIINETKQQAKNIIRDLKGHDYVSRPEVDRHANEINQQIKEIEENFARETEEKNVSRNQDIEVGDQVRVKSVGQKGEVLSIDRDRNEVQVQAGIMKVTSGLEDLEKVEMPDTREREMLRKYKVSKTEKVSPSIDLRGERYEDAQRKLDKYLDDAFLAGFKEVEIIHGKGTGALRDAVHEVLEEHPHTPSYRLGRQKEGGTGVTIITLNN